MSMLSLSLPGLTIYAIVYWAMTIKHLSGRVRVSCLDDFDTTDLTTGGHKRDAKATTTNLSYCSINCNCPKIKPVKQSLYKYNYDL